MKIEMPKESATELENMARYICCILPEDESTDIIQHIRTGRRALCKALSIKYNLSDEIKG